MTSSKYEEVPEDAPNHNDDHQEPMRAQWGSKGPSKWGAKLPLNGAWRDTCSL